MNGFQRRAGINITTSRLQFIEVEKVSDQLVVSNVGQTFNSPPINFDFPEEEILLGQLQSAFDDIKIRNPILSTIASFTLPPELFITLQLPYDANLTQMEVREELNWEISQLFPYIPIEELAIKFYELEKGLLPGKNNALVVALRKKYLLLIKNFCLKNNLTPRLVDSASITSNSFINSSIPSDKDSVIVHIYNSRHTITLFVNLTSKSIYVKVFQKRDEDILSSISELLALENFKNFLHRPLITALVTGEDIDANSLSELYNASGLEFKKFNPFNYLKLKPGIAANELMEEHYNTFTSASGIASRFT